VEFFGVGLCVEVMRATRGRETFVGKSVS